MDTPILDPQKAEDLENGVNQGVIEPTLEEQEAGAITIQSVDEVGALALAPDGNWDKFLSDYDPQYLNTFDTLGCNIFSGIAGLEMFLNALGNQQYLGENSYTELSERYNCVASGLNGSMGSSEGQWENGVNTFGFVKHSLWPWDMDTSKDTFFEPLPTDIIAAGKLALQRFTITHRPVGTDLASIKEALKYAPVKIFIATGSYWNNGEPSVIPPTPHAMNHAVIVRRIDDLGIHIRDQYPPYLKVLDANYKIYYAFQTILTPKGTKSMQLTIGADGKTFYLEGDLGKLGFADPASFDKIKSLTSQGAEVTNAIPPTNPNVPIVGIFEQGIVIHN